jgi:hypothetical protein
MQGYSEDANRTTLDRKAAQARDRRARKKERREVVSVLKGMKVLAVQEAITRAPRSEKVTTKDGRVRVLRIGAHVAAMCRQLLYWEGKGEASSDWVHKTAAEWEASDAALTAAKLRTARRVGHKEERLWEEKEGLRPGDHRPTVYYRLDVWRMAQVVVASEIANTKWLLARERRKSQCARLKRKLRELETARDDLGLIVIDHQKTANPQPTLQSDTSDVPGDTEIRPTMPIGKPDCPA